MSENPSETDRLVSESEATRKEDTKELKTEKKGDTEDAPLIGKSETVVVVPTNDTTTASASPLKHQPPRQSQRQRSGPLKIAVFIKKPIKGRKRGQGKVDNGNMYTLELEKGKSSTGADIKEKMLRNLSIPRTSAHMFALWFVSPYLELQIKPHHKPFQLRRKWKDLLSKLSNCPADELHRDEPVVVLQRNSFISVVEEKTEEDPVVLKLLFDEAQVNVMNGRYLLSLPNAQRLGGVLLRLQQQRDFDETVHQPGFFKRTGLDMGDFLPYYAMGANKVSQYIYSNSVERKLLQQYQGLSDKLPNNLSCYKMFLEVCRELPFYGSAFFKGACYQENLGYKKWKNPRIPVTVAINAYGVSIFRGDCDEVLSHLPHASFYWDCKEDEDVDNDGDVDEDDRQFVIEYKDAEDQTRLMQIITKQAGMMDAMVQSFYTHMDDSTHIEIPEDQKADLTRLNNISSVRDPSA